MLLVAEIKHLNALMDNKPLVTLRQSNKYANNQPEKKESRNQVQLPANYIVLPWPTYR